MPQEPGADLRAVCLGEPELFSAALRVVGERCLDERALVRVQVLLGERGLPVGEWVPVLVEGPVAPEAYCLGEKASASALERALRSDELVQSGVEAPDAQAAHRLDVKVSAEEPAQVVTVLAQAESVRVWRCWGPVGSAPPEFFPASLHCGCPFRPDGRLQLHRVVRGSPKLASCGSCSLPADAEPVRPSSERAADARPLFLPVSDEP